MAKIDLSRVRLYSGGRRNKEQWETYAFAFVSPFIALTTRYFTWPLFHDTLPHVTFYLAIVLSAFFGGFGCGIVSTLMAIVVDMVFSINPVMPIDLSLESSEFILYCITGMLISIVFESMHRTRRQLERSRQQLEYLNQEMQTRMIIRTEKLEVEIAKRKNFESYMQEQMVSNTALKS